MKSCNLIKQNLNYINLEEGEIFPISSLESNSRPSEGNDNS